MINPVASPSSDPVHPEIIRSSLDRYRADLLARRGALGPAAQRATGRLLETIDAALDHAATMTADEVRFTATSLAGIRPEELAAFVNEYTLGVGWDGAPVVVMVLRDEAPNGIQCDRIAGRILRLPLPRPVR